MDKKDFYYDLPERLIAQQPLQHRADSRMLVLHRDGGNEHRHFYDICEYLQKGDTLVINETSVIPARLYGQREKTDAKVELLLLKSLGGDQWEVLVKPGKRVREGEWLSFGDMLRGYVISRTDEGGRIIRFEYDGDFYFVLDNIGDVPLPPYIHEKAPMERYQTVYASQKGSVAAPTAGLHFTPELLQRIQDMGVEVVKALLHVGLGTFRPVDEADITNHKMHSEYYSLSEQAAQRINDTKQRGGRVIAVGTTSVRLLETAADEAGRLHQCCGWTDIFIYPGYEFKIVDGMVTNFHLPESTLLMLVSAFAGRERIMEAYNEAIERQYRFFSFGDAMLII